jgi:AbrB family looped-hinge helix DNA binding protein
MKGHEMRITSKGQVTIPAEIREKAGFLPHTEVEFIFDGKSVRIVKAEATKGESRGAEVIRRLKGSATIKMTTNEVMAMTRDWPPEEVNKQGKLKMDQE